MGALTVSRRRVLLQVPTSTGAHAQARHSLLRRGVYIEFVGLPTRSLEAGLDRPFASLVSPDLPCLQSHRTA